jgi:hypothetical protein
VLLVALALGIGATLVLLGAGGSIVTVPALVYAGGLDAHRAAGTSLLVVGLVAGVGALARRRAVVARTGLVFGAAGMLGATGGVWLNHAVPGAIVMLCFSVTLLLAARRMAGGAPLSPFGGRGGGWRTALVCGAGVGVATGFFGVGGGFLIVPALTVCLAVEMEAATATSLLVIALNSAAGLVGHAAYGAVDWRLGAGFAAAALAGAALALPLVRRVPTAALRRAFAVTLVVLGLGVLAHTVIGLSAPPPRADSPPRATP